MAVASQGWTPSFARTVTVVEPAGAQLRGVTVAALPLTWPPKAPVEQLDFTLDLSVWLADGEDVTETLVPSISPHADSTDLGLIWASIFGGNPTVFLGGGTQGQSYIVDLLVTTTAGRVALFSVGLLVSNASASAVPPPPLPAAPNALVSSAGVLTLDNGTPLLLS